MARTPGERGDQSTGELMKQSPDVGDPALTANGVMRNYPISDRVEAIEQRARRRSRQIADGDLDPKCIR